MPPRSFTYDAQGIACVAGARIPDLASAFGTPLYLIDEGELRTRITEYAAAAGAENLAYASKALLIGRVAKLIEEAGMLLDVVGQGELEFALRVGFPAERILLHGVYKSAAALRLAAKEGVGRIVVDSLEEIPAIAKASRDSGRAQDILIRLQLGIDPHTHPSLATSVPLSQFGISLDDGQALEAVRLALAADGVVLRGYHSHIGSAITELAPFRLAAEALGAFAVAVQTETGFWPDELDLGGGLGIQEGAPTPLAVVEEARDGLAPYAADLGRPLPRLIFEPGRYLVGPSGITVYRVVGRKRVGDGRTYLFVDGGMSDNPRPSLYGSYPLMLATHEAGGETEEVDIAGLHCETGDVLARGVLLPPLHAGDYLVALDTGAYNHSMSSHYNRVATPPVVFVRDGVARPATRRDSLADWLRFEVGI
ncbi:MAG: diaminopimelate decarboxylase [Thermaerobacter sp.]|nr:diaminopimelate decarboxylase [Thermaerobacter sp.]